MSSVAYKFTLLILFSLLALTPVRSAPGQQSGRYIVRLVAAPRAAEVTLAQAATHDAALDAALAAIQAALDQPLTPLFTYRHALSGFALDLTPAQADVVRRLPMVAAVQPEGYANAQSDTSPALLGVAQADLRPALFHANMQSAPSSASGRALAHYDATNGTLRLQIFYRGLAAPLHSAELRERYGEAAISLDALVVHAASALMGSLVLPVGMADLLLDGRLEIRLSSADDLLRGTLVASRGAGVLVGLIDTGIDPHSPAFQNPAPDGYVHHNPRATPGFLGVCDPANPRYDFTFPCSNKLVGAYTFAATADAPDPQGRPSPRDNHGHGSHTAGIVVGNYVPQVPVGLAQVGPVAGVAPHASLIVYDGCGLPTNALACPHTALLAAIDQAIADGVQVINYAVGAGAMVPWESLEALGLWRAVAQGIFVVAAAGNGGATPDSIRSPANAPWVLAATASSHGRRFVSQLTTFSGGTEADRPATPLLGAGFAPGLAQTSIRSAAALGNAACAPFSSTQAAQAAGKIIVCEGGSLGRHSQASNVLQAGGIGAVLLNSVSDGGYLDDEERYLLPAVQLSHDDGLRLLAWLSACSDCRAALSGTQAFHDPALRDRILSFSSRGPNSRLPSILKPDIAAPGQATLAPFSDQHPSQPDYTVMQGSSMAVAQISGLAALLRQLHPTWTPAELASALMLTATPAFEDDGSPAGPFAQGAGRADGALAAFAGFVLPIAAQDFTAANPAQGGDPTQLNLATLTNPRCERSCQFTRTLRSTLDLQVTYAISLTDGAGFNLTTQPAEQITLIPGASATITITATVNGLATGRYSEGAVHFIAPADLAPPAAMPVTLQTFGVTLPPSISVRTSEATGSQRLTLYGEALEALHASIDGFSPEGLLSVSHPLSTTAGMPFDLTLHWQLAPSPSDQRYTAQLKLREMQSGRDLGSATVTLDLLGSGVAPEPRHLVYLPLVQRGADV